MTEHRPGTGTRSAAALAVTVGVAAACWIVTVRQMSGMDMGVATTPGSFAFFIGLWVPMMAAMMLPAAVPAVLAFVRRNRRLLAAPLFVAGYIAVWTAIGVAVYALDRRHGYTAAGALTIAAGLYELTPLKRACRRRCRERVHSGLEFGVYCVGSSAGLMGVLLALGVMSLTWTAVVAVLVLVQKLLPPQRVVDGLVALGVVGLGLLVVLVPGSVPGLVGP